MQSSATQLGEDAPSLSTSGERLIGRAIDHVGMLRETRCVQPAGKFDYVLLSDVHLGSDLVTHLRPWAATSWLTREAEVDDKLVSLLAYHRTRRHDRPLCVVMAGDFLDLVGVSLSPEDSLRTTPTSEEREHGLGSAPDHVVRKVWAIARRHPRVFHAMMELVAEGNQLVLVRGNHDIELYWYAAQHAFVEAVLEHAPPEQRAEMAQRIAIHPWFFAVPGVLYVEHGHQFDPMCSYGDPLSSTCPIDSRRIRSVPFSVMLRNVARPTRGLSTSAYEHASFGAYFGLMMRLGARGCARIALRFARAASKLVGTWVAHVQGEGCRRRHAAALRKARFSARQGVERNTLCELESLYVRPASHSLAFVLCSLYLDRVAAVAAALLFTVLGALLARSESTLEGIVCALPAALFAAYAVFGVERDIFPTRRMQSSASRIAALFDARWVVMGHTHEPLEHALADGPDAPQYVNLGHWGEDDLPEERQAGATTSCTYLHLRMEGDRYRADLMRWDDQLGPRKAVVPQHPGDESEDRPEGKAPRPGKPLLGAAT
jgi:UDP-2,3-diacylglucosamine pyrophosphatase LpxH